MTTSKEIISKTTLPPSRIPPKKDIRLLFWTILTITNFWAFINFAYYAVRVTRILNVMDSISTLAYVLSLTIPDTIIALILVGGFTLLLPIRFTANKFIRIGFTTFLAFTFFFNFIVLTIIVEKASINLTLLWGICCLILGIIFYILFGTKVFTKIGSWFAQRIQTVGILYLILDIASLFIVLIRNLIGRL